MTLPMRISGPCDEPWEAMEPRPGGRFCGRCDKTVLDLSGMTRAQAEARVRRVRGGSVCVQLALGPDGDAVFRPEPARAPHWAGGVVLVAALTAGGCGADEPAPQSVVAVLDEAAPEERGPPMMPVDPMMPADEARTPVGPTLSTGPVDPATLDHDDDGRPTAEQRALTARKQQAAMPPLHHARGMMVLPSY